MTINDDSIIKDFSFNFNEIISDVEFAPHMHIGEQLKIALSPLFWSVIMAINIMKKEFENSPQVKKLLSLLIDKYYIEVRNAIEED